MSSSSARSLLAFVGQASRRATLRASPVASSSKVCLRCESTSAAAPPSTSSAAPTHYRITLRRSGIGMPEKTNRILTSLGLTKRLQSVYRPIGPEMAGTILAVKELLHVDNVRRLDPSSVGEVSDAEAVWVNEQGEVVDAGKSSRKAPRGYRIVGNMVNETRDREIKSRQQQA